MMFTIVGFPSSGNHALLKACQHYGLPAQITHLPFAEHDPAGSYLCLCRHPRDVLVSFLRKRGPVTERRLVNALIGRRGEVIAWRVGFKGRRHRTLSAPSFGEALLQFRNWQIRDEWPKPARDWYRIRFEELVACPDLSMLPGATMAPMPEQLFGGTRSWSGRLSRWREHWTPQVDLAWRAASLPELERVWGYGEARDGA